MVRKPIELDEKAMDLAYQALRASWEIAKRRFGGQDGAATLAAWNLALPYYTAGFEAMSDTLHTRMTEIVLGGEGKKGAVRAHRARVEIKMEAQGQMRAWAERLVEGLLEIEGGK